MPRPARPVPDAEQLQREGQALELRRAGLTYDAIAERLGFANKGGAYKAVKRALQRTLQEPADELRALEVDRLDRLQAAIWPKAMRGDTAAVDRVLRIAERRARLLGLDITDVVMRDIAEQRLQIEQQQGAVFAQLIAATLAEVGVDPNDPKVLQVVSTRLRALGPDVAA